MVSTQFNPQRSKVTISLTMNDILFPGVGGGLGVGQEGPQHLGFNLIGRGGGLAGGQLSRAQNIRFEAGQIKLRIAKGLKGLKHTLIRGET